ncbi:TPA: serine acetyltransferase [Photobacterium damselae]
MKKTLDKLFLELKINTSFSSRIAIVILRGERIKYLRYFFLPFRVIILNFMFNTEIPRSVYIGRGLRIPHPYNIIINSKSKIGRFCTIYQGVTLGANDLSQNYGSPKISNYVLIGAGSIIIGNIDINKNSIICANSLVNKSIPSNSFFRNDVRKNKQSIIEFSRFIINEKVRNNKS